MIRLLQFINEELTEQRLNYAFMEWNDKVEYPYFIGEYVEVTNPHEDGMEEFDFIITGFTRDTWIGLEKAKNQIKYIFPQSGRTGMLSDLSRVAVYYSHSFPVPTGEADLKKIEIHLTIKRWKGDE